MAESHRLLGRAARRLAGVVCASLLLAGLAAPARAGLKQRLDDAKARLVQIRDEIERQQGVLAQLSEEAAVLAEKREAAEGRLDLITEQLMQTRGELGDVRDRYEEVQDQLNDRLRQTYMNGPASSLEFLLGATTFSDLSDRMEYVDALAETDNDLAIEVANLRSQLAAQARAQERLREKQAQLVSGLQRDEAALKAKLDEQQRVLDDIQAEREEAAALVDKLGKQYAQYLRSLSSVHIANSGVFRVCPVDQPRAYYDGFGAPRYTGGYHPHAGNDFVAPLGTPIRAPFDGTASSSFNALGGNAVYVRGALGYVYNAHLDHYSDKSNGPVKAGDIIGYVGWTGDAFGGVYHDHFEWHPYHTPDSWPESAYGYSVINTGSVPAVNPYPLLQQVC